MIPIAELALHLTAADNEPTATPEERERAAAKWFGELRPAIAPDLRVGAEGITDERDRQAAEGRLDELRAAADEPVAIGDGLARIIDGWLWERARYAVEIDGEAENRAVGGVR